MLIIRFTISEFIKLVYKLTNVLNKNKIRKILLCINFAAKV
jgi:hypothetical protein